MELTREQAIAEHRKMWKWISRQIMKDYKENYSIKTIVSYKKIYIENNFKNEYVRSSCFCCSYGFSKYIYDESAFGICYSCPLYWNTECTKTECTKGYYGSLNRIFNNATIGLVTKDSTEEYFVCEGAVKKLSRMAYKIAMLEERKDNV
jgi:hypothetical protein